MGANTHFPEYSEEVKRIIISAFNCLDSPKIIVDTQGIILYVSKYHLKYLGYNSEDELIAVPIWAAEIILWQPSGHQSRKLGISGKMVTAHGQ